MKTGVWPKDWHNHLHNTCIFYFDNTEVQFLDSVIVFSEEYVSLTGVHDEGIQSNFYFTYNGNFYLVCVEKLEDEVQVLIIYPDFNKAVTFTTDNRMLCVETIYSIIKSDNDDEGENDVQSYSPIPSCDKILI